MNPRLKIVFDFGGVLFNWHPPSLLQRELPHRATDERTAAHWVAQIFQGYGGDWGDFDRGTVEPAALVARIAERTGLSHAEVQAVVDGVPAELRAMPATVALLQRLREAGHPLYYLSNMPAPYASHLEAEHGFIDWFQGGVFSARVKLVKPERAIYELAAERFGAAPAELLFIDDVAHNVEAARDAGWQALHFTDAPTCERDLRGLGLI